MQIFKQSKDRLCCKEKVTNSFGICVHLSGLTLFSNLNSISVLNLQAFGRLFRVLISMNFTAQNHAINDIEDPLPI